MKKTNVPNASPLYAVLDRRRGLPQYSSRKDAEEYCLYAYGPYLVPVEPGDACDVDSHPSEALYRTTHSFVLEATAAAAGNRLDILVLGCGVGRLIRDLSANPHHNVIGVDLSAPLLDAAASILLSDKRYVVDGAAFGRTKYYLQGLARKNVRLFQADATNLPVDFPAFVSKHDCKVDVVVADMLIDRLRSWSEVQQMVSAVVARLRPGGLAVVSTGFNWQDAATWSHAKGRHPVEFLRSLFPPAFRMLAALHGIPYEEAIDPYRTRLRLDVSMVALRWEPA